MKEKQTKIFSRFFSRVRNFFKKSKPVFEKPVLKTSMGSLERDFDSKKLRSSYSNRYLRHLFGLAVNSYGNCHKGCRKVLMSILKKKLESIDTFDELKRDLIMCELLDQMFMAHEWEDFNKITKELVRFEKDLATDIVKRAVYRGSMIAHPILVGLLLEKYHEYGSLTPKEEHKLYRIVDHVIQTHINKIESLTRDELIELIRGPVASEYNQLSKLSTDLTTKHMFDLKAKLLEFAA